jgi:hypothetical protein
MAKKIPASAVPANVMESFKKDFKGSSGVIWELEGGNYEANFKQKGQKMAAVFEPGGTLKETELQIPLARIPKEAVNYVHQHFKGQKIIDTAKLMMPDGTVDYEIGIKGKDVIFDSKGAFVRTRKA